MSARPDAGHIALPSTAPGVHSRSMAFIACPGVDDVVKRSPISIAAGAASNGRPAYTYNFVASRTTPSTPASDSRQARR